MPKRPPTISTANSAPKNKSRAPQIHYCGRWKRHSKRMRQRFPLCQADFCKRRQAGNWPAAESVHHIEPAWRRPDLAFAISNTIPICNNCHGYIETLERKGIDTREMFAKWTMGDFQKWED